MTEPTSDYTGPAYGMTATGALRTWPIWGGPAPEDLLHPWQHMPVPLTPLVAPAPLTDPALEGRDEY